MLTSLHIRNFAIIEDVSLEWGPALNVLSGETGAGKSIIIQALSLLMGQRGSSDWIRKGEEDAIVTGLFQVSDETAVLQKLNEWNVPLDGTELLIQRTLSLSGRNQVRLNGLPVTVAMLAELGESLVDIVSQKEHEMLLRPEIQRDLLDEYGNLESLRASYRQTLETLHGLQKKLQEFETSSNANREMEEFLRFQLREIKEAHLKPDEDTELRQQKAKLKNATQLGELCTLAEQVLVSGEDTVHQRLRQLEQGLAKVADLDQRLADLHSALESVQVQLDEVGRTFSNYLDELQFEPGRLEAIESRLAEIDRLKKKYGTSIDEIIAFGEEVRSKLSGLDNYQDRLDELQQEMARVGKELVRDEKKLQESRKKIAQKLEKEVNRELADLGMEHSRFQINWEPVTTGLLMHEERNYDRYGAMRTVFYLESNPGEDPKLLAKVASGGERSRILLAIKKVLVDVANLGTAVYDEVDDGIGGATASKVGEKLAGLGKKRQVVCITHQPQIAACADRHFVIEKQLLKSRMLTSVRCLDDKEREQEIARMLAGKEVTTQARKHAREMLRGVAG